MCCIFGPPFSTGGVLSTKHLRRLDQWRASSSAAVLFLLAGSCAVWRLCSIFDTFFSFGTFMCTKHLRRLEQKRRCGKNVQFHLLCVLPFSAPEVKPLRRVLFSTSREIVIFNPTVIYNGRARFSDLRARRYSSSQSSSGVSPSPPTQ